MSRKVNFTKAVLEAAKPPAPGQRLVLIDTKERGLQCRITSNGVKTFSVFRRVKGGQPERITLGKFDEMSVEQARTQAAQINSAIAQGANPAQVKRVNKEELTFGEIFEDYASRHARLKKRMWHTEEGRYRLYLEKPLGKKKLSQISKDDITKIYKAIPRQVIETRNADKKNPRYKSGATANRVLALASTIFSWGMQEGECDINPAKGIKKEREKSRERFLQTDELPRFFKALSIEQNTAIRDYVLLSLLTGARRENVLSMRWEQISFERKEWRIPRTKNGEAQTVPLGEEVLEVLRERKAVQEKKDRDNKDKNFDFVFPGAGRTGHLAEPRKGWLRILKRAEIKDLRLHDLRRTLGSWQARTGASLIVIGKSLNHKSHATTQIYSRLDIDPVRKSVETATSAILEAAGVKKTAEVKPFKKQKK